MFAARVTTAAAVLHETGIRAGDVVAVILPNRVDFVVTLFAAWQLGATVTPVNPTFTDEEARGQIVDSAAKAVITDAGRAIGTLDVAALQAPTTHAPDPVGHTADSLALLIYTSGTTGKPKGVMLDHGNVAALCRMFIEGFAIDETDHSLLILPLFHVNGLLLSVLCPLVAGGCASITGRFRASTFFEEVRRRRPTYFSAVPAIYAMLVSLPDSVVPDASSLRRAICGGAPMSAELIGLFERRFGVPIFEGYGLSEATCAVTVNPVAGQRKPGTVGLPLPGLTVAVMGADGTLLEAGTPGEVVVRGPSVMRGYLGLPEATAQTIVNGWLHTGDIGYLDADGYLVLVDRIKDMIIRGGENIYPKEIENVLHTHLAVLEAAVVGIPDSVVGEVPVAYVVPLPNKTVTDGELLTHCRLALARIKVPVTIFVTDSLPRNPSGKIDKRVLRSLSSN